ncbi:PD-(D/E)XK nuclease family protein [Clostridium sp. A1-XYC3]|uniref:PD-(D/E)XK nuclease family protein n=1 Tax=Clostridium tanneri TaxID=3037988 RepID=A0ABU4JWV6_9CLOT|nr:PD-(D/E)XK nuclease family protein [Clostridium sp. A1-XYC3]MDW8802640.1 PD-(D/E)XK nuclease family protein [Clostridium sp. A1-XYC3]
MGYSNLYSEYLRKEFFNSVLVKRNSNKSKVLKSNKFLSFDQSIHQTMADFNMIIDREEKTIKMLLNLLERNWIEEGYESYREEGRFKIRAHNMLLSYYYNPQDIGIDSLITNKTLRKKINKRVTLFAKVDKVIERADGSIEVIDYKSGYVRRHADDFPLDLRCALTMILVYYQINLYPSYISYYYLNYNKKVTKTIRNIDINYAFILMNNFISAN